MKKQNSSNETVCSICGQIIVREFGNNAQPINDGICCDNCNYTVVIPARIYLVNKLGNNNKD